MFVYADRRRHASVAGELDDRQLMARPDGGDRGGGPEVQTERPRLHGEDLLPGTAAPASGEPPNRSPNVFEDRAAGRDLARPSVHKNRK